MRAVSNTSPLFNLSAIHQLHLLRETFTEVLVPEAVIRELEPAVEMGIQRVLIDERDGSRIAERQGLKPVGVLGILLQAKREGRLPSVKDT
jgi:predicted nucleic acid-binding protein